MIKSGRDVVPAGESRHPATIDPKKVQQRRQMNNDEASRRRRAKVIRFQPHDRVVVQNRKPTGKFCMRYEPEV